MGRVEQRGRTAGGVARVRRVEMRAYAWRRQAGRGVIEGVRRVRRRGGGRRNGECGMKRKAGVERGGVCTVERQRHKM